MSEGTLHKLRTYWEGLRAGRIAPYRAELDPRQFEDALENMFILEQLNPSQVRIRLAGMALCEMMGMEVRGMPPEALMDADNRAAFTQHLSTVLNAPAVVHLELEARDLGGRRSKGEMLLLPLRSDFGEVTRVLGCISMTTGRIVRPPVNFAILGERTETLREEDVQTTGPVQGFAEDQAPFAGRPDQPRLRAISGTGGSGGRDDRPRSRGHLRLVQD